MRALSLALLAALAAPALAQPILERPEDERYAGDSETVTLPAETFGRAPSRLVYDHVAQTLSLVDPGGRTVETWQRGDGVSYAEVAIDRPVVVEVTNANALVYDYAVEATVSQLREAPRQCGGQARTFALAGGLLVGGALSGGAVSLPSSDRDLSDTFYDLDLTTVGSLLMTRSDGSLSASELSQVRQDATAAVAGLAALAQRLGDVRAEAEASLVDAARRGDAQPIDPLLAAIQQRLERAEAGLSDPARVPVVVADKAPRSDDVAKLLAAARAVEAGAADSGQAADDVLALADLAQQALGDLGEDVPALQQLALTLVEARDATRQAVTIRPGDDLREVAIEIAPAEAGLDGVTPVRQRTVRAYLGPQAPRGVGCAVLAALTFAPRRADYTVRFGDGVLVDEADDDGLGAAPALLFELAPPVVGSVLGAVGGVGLGDNFRPDFYAGGSLRILDPLLVVGGFVWRRERTLPDGVAVGDEVGLDPDFDAEAFLDDLPRSWTRSFFLGLSVVP